MNNRLEIEKAILGAIIYCDGFAQVAHILTAKNFTSSQKIKHRELFAVIASMFPIKRIDMITVKQEVEKIFPGNGNWVLKCNNHITASSNLTYWALILLQIDITEKFQKKLLEWKDRRDHDFDHVASGALKEIIESIVPDQDIFDLVDGAIAYFDHLDMKTEHEEAIQFSRDFLEKARKVMQVESIDAILHHLYSISRCTPELQEQCNLFGKIIADIITSGQTNERYTQALNTIYS